MMNLDHKRARWIRVRMALLSILMLGALGGILYVAWGVQVRDADSWKEIAERQRQRRLHVRPKRGGIYDRHGTALAVSVEVPSLSADVVEMIRGAESESTETAIISDAARRLAAALSLDEGKLRARMLTRRRFVWVKRRLAKEEVERVRAMRRGDAGRTPIRGLQIEGEGHRYYPGRSLGGPLLGFVAPDGEGKDGLEFALDEELRGRAEEIKGLRDRSGRLLFAGGKIAPTALAGRNTYLTIDEGLQHVAERELEAAMRTHEAQSGSLVVVDPQTGEILALVSAPGYNPNDYGDSAVESRRHRAYADRFEPGSVMKVFTVAAALNHGVARATDSVFCENGSYDVGPVTVHDTHQNGWLTLTQVLAKSSNIGALKIGLRLGEARLYAAYRSFGFGELTGLPVPGEAAGVLRPRGRPWFEVETANASFGQGVSVTTVQLAMAMAAVANGGKLLQPILVKRVSDADGHMVRENAPHVRRQVIRPDVARTVAQMLTAVTEDGGTGVEAALPGVSVGGKTATAQKADPKTGKYSEDLYTSSFVGFAPVQNPRLVVAVVLDEPSVGRYGGDLAGPVFRRVAAAGLRYLGVRTQKHMARLGDVAKAGSRGAGDKAEAEAQTAAESPSPESDPPKSAPGNNGETVPDVRGLAARDAVRVLSRAGFRVGIGGSGRVLRQSPAAGQSAPKGSSVQIALETST